MGDCTESGQIASDPGAKPASDPVKDPAKHKEPKGYINF